MSIHATSLSPHHTFSKTPHPSITLLPSLGVQHDAHCGPTVQHTYNARKTPLAPNNKQVHLLPLETLLHPLFRGYDNQPVLPGQMGENITTQRVDLHGLGEGDRLVFAHRKGGVNTALGYLLAASKTRPYTISIALVALAAALAILLRRRRLAYTLLLPVLLTLSLFPSLAPSLYKHTLPRGPIVRITGLRKPCGQINDFRAGLLKRCYQWEGGRKRERCGVMGVVERGGEVEEGMRVLVAEREGGRREMGCV
jgi:MOSC domain-containing protein YiiM